MFCITTFFQKNKFAFAKCFLFVFSMFIFVGAANAVSMNLNKAGGSGALGTSTGTAAVRIKCQGSSCLLPSVGGLTRDGSIYTQSPLYMPGTTTAPILGSSIDGNVRNGSPSTIYSAGVWCNAVYGNGTTCFAGNTTVKIKGNMQLYAMWSCDAGYYAPDQDTCVQVEAGYYSPYQELDKHDCPAGSYCPAGSAAANPCPSSHPLSDPLNDEIGKCYADTECPLAPNATAMSGRDSYDAAYDSCEIVSCEAGYNIIDGMCIQGCPSGQYLSGTTCIECTADNYCLGGFTPQMECPTEFPFADAGSHGSDHCYSQCEMWPNATAMSGYNFYDGTTTCAASACATDYTVVNSECELTCAIGYYSEDETTCVPCLAGYWCPADTPFEQDCKEGFYCPTGAGAQLGCPEDYPNSDMHSDAMTDCYAVGSCSLTTGATQMTGYNFYGGSSTCKATACQTDYDLIDGACVPAADNVSVTFYKSGGTGTLLGATGTIAPEYDCNGDQCTLPSAAILTRANSTAFYAPDGTYHANGMWCTGPNGTGVCYEGGTTITLTEDDDDDDTGTDQYLYAMFTCMGGYYAANDSTTACVQAGSGYFSPAYSYTRTACEEGNYCTGTTLARQTPCPETHPDSGPMNLSVLNCRTGCTLTAGAATMVSGGYDYYGITDTCAAASCNTGYDLTNGVCIPTSTECDPGYYYNGTSCSECAAGNYCPGGENAPSNPCPEGFIRSASKNENVSTCYANCAITENAVSMTGYNYYMATDTCAPSACKVNYALENGVCVLNACPMGQFMNGGICDTCGAGLWYAGAGTSCESVGTSYYSPMDDSRRYQCPVNKLSGGNGEYADSIIDCTNYKTLKISDGTNLVSIIMRTQKMTSPALNVYDGANVYYGNLSGVAPSGRGIHIGNYYLSSNQSD
ncbi:MAG: hypothetical protein LBL75_03650 [Rickettsiales bacterium]|jgi:hypothetical protein|nr:hypothetical protein [Rickettsiales bacterium]